jgi:peptide deformylase
MVLAKPRYVENAVCVSISSPKDIVNLDNTIKDMIEICRLHNGVGLAAPQVGIRQRFFIAFSSDKEWKLFINPRYVPIGNEKYNTIEGCLTYGPEPHYLVQRYEKVQAIWQEIQNRILVDKTKVLEGVFAQIFQHETDHCDGVTTAMIGKLVKSD